MSTPDYVLEEDFSYSEGNAAVDNKVLPAGTFVRPIDNYYVPTHIKNDERWAYTNKDTYVFCYTHYGIVPIPKNLIRKK